MIVVAMLSILFQACNNDNEVKDTMQIDIVGSWKSSDGAMLIINKDSTFTGKSLPAEFFSFFTSKQEVQGKKVEGSGKWKIEKGQGFKKVKLDFRKMNNENIYGNYSVLIAGKNGILENKPPWYLFVWKEEEGGERYEFLKQETTKPQ